MSTDGAPRAIIWTDDRRLETCRLAAQAAGLHLVGAGSPERGRSAAIAQALGCEPEDDLRSVLLSAEVDLLLIGSTGEFGSGDAKDARAMLDARSRGVRIAALEPIPGSALDLASSGWTRPQHGVRPSDCVRIIPLVRRHPLMRSVGEDVLREFGDIDTLFINLMAGAGQSPLSALLYSAMDLVLGWVGEPEIVHANWRGATGTSGERWPVSPPDRLTDLHGHLTANLRLPGGVSAAIVCSDNAGRWERGVTALGVGGRLEVGETELSWISPTGQEVDHHEIGVSAGDRGERGERNAEQLMGDAENACIGAIAESLRSLLDAQAPDEGRSNHAAVMASAHTALLSARTGNGESPEPIRRAISGA